MKSLYLEKKNSTSAKKEKKGLLERYKNVHDTAEHEMNGRNRQSATERGYESLLSSVAIV